MSDFVQFPPLPPDENRETLYLVGFRLDPGTEAPQLFTLLAMHGDNDRPATADGRILFFVRPEQAPTALASCDNGLQQLGAAPAEVAFLCDVATSLHIINALDADEDGLVSDLISCFDALVRATRINVPAQYMSALSALAERLNEDSEFASWLAEQGVDRETIEDAVMWCVGAVTVKSTVLHG